MKRYQNLILIVFVVLLAAFPLMFIHKPEAKPGGQEVEIFTGSDDQAKDAISVVDPNYHPWFRSLMVPPSGEIESLLFALQASLGAGFIGYYFGTRKVKKSQEC